MQGTKTNVTEEVFLLSTFSVILSQIHGSGNRHRRKRNKGKNQPRKSNVIMNVRPNFKRKGGRRRLHQKQRVEFHLQRLPRRQHRQSEQPQLISVFHPLHQRMYQMVLWRGSQTPSRVQKTSANNRRIYHL